MPWKLVQTFNLWVLAPIHVLEGLPTEDELDESYLDKYDREHDEYQRA